MFFNKSLSAVKQNKLFAGVNFKNLVLNIKQNNFVEVPEGEIIYQNGDKREILYLICEGTVKLKINSDTARKIIYKNKNDFLGEIEIFGKTQQKSSAVANTDVLLYKLVRKDIVELLSQNEQIKINITESINNALREEENFQEFSPGEVVLNKEEIPSGEFTNKENETEEQISDNISEDNFGSKKPADKNLLEEIELKPFEQSAQPANELIDEISSQLKEQPQEVPQSLTKAFETNQLFDTSAENNNYENQNSFHEKINEDIKAEKMMHQIINDLIYLYRSNNLTGVIENTIELAKNFTGAKYGKFFLIDNLYKNLNFQIISEGKVTSQEFNFSYGIAGASAANKEVINLTNPANDKRFHSGIDSLSEEEVKNILCYPIKNNLGEAVVLLQLFNTSKEAFTSEDEKYLEYLSPHIVNILNNIIEIEKLIATNKLDAFQPISEFIIGDIKTPLSIIKKYSDFIKKVENTVEIRQIANFIITQTENIKDFLGTISDYIQSKKTIFLSSIKLNELLNEILSMLAEFVEQHNVKIYKRYETELQISVDKLKLFQVFFQLTKIFCSYMKDGGNIYLVASKHDDKFLKISFKSSSKGIAAYLDFSNVQSNNPANFSYLIAGKIIRDHDGELKVIKNGNDEIEFLIFLPT